MRKRRVKARSAQVALLFAALGDETRLALLQRLADEGPASISVLAERFSMTRQGVTKHLHVLADAGMIDGVRDGREHVWTLNPSRLAEARRTLETLARGWESALTRLKAHIEDG